MISSGGKSCFHTFFFVFFFSLELIKNTGSLINPWIEYSITRGVRFKWLITDWQAKRFVELLVHRFVGTEGFVIWVTSICTENRVIRSFYFQFYPYMFAFRMEYSRVIKYTNDIFFNSTTSRRLSPLLYNSLLGYNDDRKLLEKRGFWCGHQPKMTKKRDSQSSHDRNELERATFWIVRTGSG